jgi:hypothetical protein
MTGKIFISYRRDDSAPHGLSIAQYLERQFGGDSVFIDVDRIRAGENFVSVLNDRLGLSNVMLTVIGPNWVKARDSSGKRLPAALLISAGGLAPRPSARRLAYSTVKGDVPRL